jgi:hypothetical protein
MYEMLPLPVSPKNVGKKKAPTINKDGDTREGLFDVSNMTKAMDVFWSTLEDFIPEGKHWDDLTKTEQHHIKDQYRFAFLRPGEYQAITGIGGKMGQMY